MIGAKSTKGRKEPDKNKSRQGVVTACNACRARKVACDGQRPACGKCAGRGRACEYDTREDGESKKAALRRELSTLRDIHNKSETLWTHLLSVSEEESIALLKHLRDTSAAPTYASGTWNTSSTLLGQTATTTLISPADSLQFYGAILHPAQLASLSEHSVHRSLLPPTCSRLEYQLMVSHSAIYPCFADFSGGKVFLEPLLNSTSENAAVHATQRKGLPIE